MSPCLPEIYAQSYKDEQNLEMRCLCINSNTKDIEKRKEDGYCLSTGIALSLDNYQIWPQRVPGRFERPEIEGKTHRMLLFFNHTPLDRSLINSKWPPWAKH